MALSPEMCSGPRATKVGIVVYNDVTASFPGADMGDRLDEAKSELLAKAAAAAGHRGANRPEIEAFLRRFYRHVAPEDLVDRDPVDVIGAAMSHRQFAQTRPQGRSLVRVYTPTVEEHGWSSGHTVVEVVTDDMPFLVDSVTMTLTRRDRAIHLVVHPQFVVRRDIAGELLEVCDVGESDPAVAEMPDALVESWMHIETDRETNPAEQEKITDELRNVLRDVRDAVEDWQRMQSALRGDRRRAGEEPATGSGRGGGRGAGAAAVAGRRPFHLPRLSRVHAGYRRR